MALATYQRDALTIGGAVGVFGAAFGALGSTTGLSVAQSMAMSLLVFTGASQFTAVSVIGAGGTTAAALGAALLLALRNGLYGLTMSNHLGGGWARRALAAHLTIDESTALATAQTDRRLIEPAFWAAGMSVFVFWNTGTLLGAWAAERVAEPEALGLDAAFPAGFVALLAPSLRHRPVAVAAATGAGIALLTLPVTQPGVPVLAAGLGAVVAYLVAR